MGVSTDGILVFGIDLDEELPEQWQEYEDFDFNEMVAEDADVWPWRKDMTEDEKTEYWSTFNKAVNACPVELVTHCSYEYPMYILAVRGFAYNAKRGYPQEITSEDMNVPKDKIDAMKLWMEEHELEWSEPKWLLCSVWG